MTKPAIKELYNSNERTRIQLELDTDALTTIKILANLKGDSTPNMINDIVRAFADRNNDILDDFKAAAVKTYDSIKW